MMLKNNIKTEQTYFKISEPIDDYVYEVDKEFKLVPYNQTAEYNLLFIAYNNNDELVNSINNALIKLEHHPNIIILDCNSKAQLPAILLKNFMVINNINFCLLEGKFKDYTIEEQVILSYIYCVKKLINNLPTCLYNGDD